MSKWAEQRQREVEAQEAEKRAKEEVPQGEAALEGFEQGFKDALQEARDAFNDSWKKEKDMRHSVGVDTNFYFCVYFKDFPQLKEFCDKFGLDANQIFIDGKEFSRKLGKAIQTPDPEFAKEKPLNRDYIARSMKE